VVCADDTGVAHNVVISQQQDVNQSYVLQYCVMYCVTRECRVVYADDTGVAHNVVISQRQDVNQSSVLQYCVMSHVYRHSATVLVAFAFQGPPSGAHSHKTYEAVTFPGNSSSMDLRHGCLSVLMCRWRI